MSIIQGIVTGTVTKLNKEKPGEIKVRFNAHEETHETDWVRIATTMGGKNRGTFIPPANDVRLRRIQSVNGHSITFIDSTPNAGSKGALVIEDAHGNVITMSNGKITIKSKGLLELEGKVVRINGRVVSPTPNPI